VCEGREKGGFLVEEKKKKRRSDKIKIDREGKSLAANPKDGRRARQSEKEKHKGGQKRSRERGGRRERVFFKDFYTMWRGKVTEG